DLAASPGGLGVVAAPIQLVERLPELPAGDIIRLTGDGSDRQDRRSRLLRECRALHAGTGEDERAGRRIQLLAAELEGRAAFEHQVELLLGVVAVVLVVLVDDPVAGIARRPRVDPEGRDAEVMPDGPPRAATVGRLLDLVQ